MKRISATLATLAFGVFVQRAAASPPLITVRLSSLNAALRDLETVSKSAQSPLSRDTLLAQLATALKVDDLSFLDLSRPAAFAMPSDGLRYGTKGFVFAVPVRDGARALDVLAKQFGERSLEGDLTVLREPPLETPSGTVEQPPTYAAVHGRVLVLGQTADMVRTFDHAAALSGEGLPPGSLAVSIEIEPIAPLLASGLAMARQRLMEMPPPGVSPPRSQDASDTEDGSESVGSGVGAATDGPPAVTATPGVGQGDPNPSAFDPRKMAGLIDLYVDVLQDAVESLSKVQLSVEVNNGFLTIHERGIARQGTALAKFIDAQRDVGMPAIGRMMPVDASVIIAGQLFWTDPSRAWMKRLMQRYQSVMTDVVNGLPESERASGAAMLNVSRLWQSDRLVDCQRGDIAYAMDFPPEGMRMLQVTGISDVDRCHGVVDSMMSTLKIGSSQQALVETEVLDPEKVTTHVIRPQLPKSLDPNGTTGKDGFTVRFAQVGDMIVSGSDPWAIKAIREAAGRPVGSTPGGGGLILADLGPFGQGPGLFGRFQLGALRRQADSAAKAREDRRDATRASGEAGAASPPTPPTEPAPYALLQALDGPAGTIPFAARFDEGAASIEVALPLAMFEAFAKHAAKPKPAPADRNDP